MELTEGNVKRDGPLEREYPGGTVRVTPIGEYGDPSQYRVEWEDDLGLARASCVFVFFGSVRNHVGALADDRVWKKVPDGTV